MSVRTLKTRLLGAAELVRQGAVFADIGTDHAHLPIFLLESGKIERAFCCDINEGPLNTAKENAIEAGVAEKIEFVLTDGATALDGLGVTDYAICGMGGELIADIIERAPDTKRQGVRLILQPMTRVAHLRSYLARRGYRIILDSYSREGDRCYVCLLCEYDGVERTITAAEAEFGAENIEIVNKSAQISYLEDKIASLSKVIHGKNRAGADICEDAEVLYYGIKRLYHAKES